MAKPNNTSTNPSGRIVVVALDETALKDIQFAKVIRLGIVRPNDEVRLLHIWNQADFGPLFPPKYTGFGGASTINEDGYAYEASEAAMGNMSRLLQHHGFQNVSFEVLRGDAKLTIVDYCIAVRPTLVVTGTRGFGVMKRAVLGSVSEYVTKNCPCPVLIIKLTKEETESVNSKENKPQNEFKQVKLALDEHYPIS